MNSGKLNEAIDTITTYFISNCKSPLFDFYEIYANNEHPLHENVLLILENIEVEDYIKINARHDIDHFIRRDSVNINIERNLTYWIFKLHEYINIKYVNSLLNDVQNPFLDEKLVPHLDKNGLISMNYFDLVTDGLVYNNKLFKMCPIIKEANSSYWIFEYLKLLNKEIDVRIRLDPFIILNPQTYLPFNYKMTLYGKKLNWDRIKNLMFDDFGSWKAEFESFSEDITDYVWATSKDEISFTCEELPKQINISYRGSRYFHAIFDKRTGNIKHCDGAIRLYTNEELIYRQQFHVRNPEVRKIGIRKKIFQIDSMIDQYTFTQLVINFFVWNEDVQKYFFI